MRKYAITMVINLNDDMETADWVADVIQEKLERNEDLVSFEVERIGQHETR
jgi:hypothetical protein